MTKAELLEELNVDKFDVPNFNRLRDFLEHLINGLGVGGNETLVKIGTITAAEMNTGAAVATFTKVFAGAIPIGKYIKAAFSKTTIAVTSTTAVNVSGFRSQNSPPITTLDAVGSVAYNFNKNNPPSQIKAVAQDLETILDLSAANANDFLTGEIEIWAILSDYPSLV